MNRCVFLARWLRHHLNARIQNLFTRHHQLRIAATEQLGEQMTKVMIDLIKGILQQIARLFIDLVNSVF